MTTQTVQIVTFDYGPSLSSVTLRNLSDDSLVATADSCNELSTDAGVYAAVFGETAVIPAGTYRLRAVVSGAPINRYVTFSGVDGEVVQASSVDLSDIKRKTDTIGTAAAVTSLLAGAVLEPGAITSFPSELVIGDSYQETDGREIQIPLVDTDGNVLTTVGSRNLADATATFEIRRINESDSTRVITGVATIVDPPGTGTGSGAPYAIVELPADETAKGLVSYRYRGKLTLTWSGPGTDVYSFDTETIKFIY